MHTTHTQLLQSGLHSEDDVLKMSADSIKMVSSSTLFGDAKDIVIAHLGEFYKLTITKQKKLLLTKMKFDVER